MKCGANGAADCPVPRWRLDSTVAAPRFLRPDHIIAIVRLNIALHACNAERMRGANVCSARVSHRRSINMRKLITALSVAAVTAAAIAMPTLASAQESGQYSTGYAGPVAGAVVGTAVGVGLYEGWFGTNAALAGSALPTTAAGAATVGGVAGVGTVALIDSVFQPCRGFHALFGANKDACVNGEYVGYTPRRMR
jgi:hypothetical protein